MSKPQDCLGTKIEKQRASAQEPFEEYSTNDLYAPEDVAEEMNGKPIADTLDRFDFMNATKEQMNTALGTSAEIKELNQLRKDCGMLKEANEKLSEADKEKDKKIEAFVVNKQVLEGQLADYKTSYESQQSLLETTKGKNAQLTEENKDLREKLAEAQKAPATNDSQLTAENARLQGALGEAAEKQKRASEAIARAKDLLQEKNEEIRKLQERIDSLEKQPAEPDDGNLKAFADLKMENLGLQTQLTESEGKAKELQVKLDKAEAEATELRTKLLGAQNEVDTLRQAQQEIPAPAADPDEELREKLERAKEWADTYAIRAQNLESNLRSTQEALEEAKNARIRAEDNKANAERELKESEEEILKLRDQLTNAEQSEKVLNLELKNCRNEINVLRSQLNAEKAAAAPKPAESIPAAIIAAPAAPIPATMKSTAPKPTPKQMVERLLALEPTVGDVKASNGATTHVVRTFDGQPVNKELLPILQAYNKDGKLAWAPITTDPDGNIIIEEEG